MGCWHAMQRRKEATVTEQAEWHGTAQAWDRLKASVQRHCACVADPGTGALTYVCPSHTMLTTDQRALNGLLFMYCISGRLIAEEHSRRTDPCE
jgi:hypothetical protein